MKRLLAFLRNLFPRFFPPPIVKWEDGVISTNPEYNILYLKTVEYIKVIAPDKIQTPTMNVTVRIYKRFPAGFEGYLGKVLAPNVIPGDIGGTLCLYEGLMDDKSKWQSIFIHEAKHAITGIPNHSKPLF